MNPKTTTQRRFDLDWLRVLVILTVFIFHTGRFFDQGGWHVKNPTTYSGVQLWTDFLASWMMPLIFVISGASLFYALGKGGFGRFAKDKVLRLLVPLVVGIFTHIPLQVYLERLTHGEFSGSFFEFVPHYFDGLYAFGGNFAWMGLHLWYLLVLFLFSLALYPLFRWLKGRGAQALNSLGNVLAKPGAVYLLALPVVLMINVLDPGSIFGTRDFGGWGLGCHVLFFIYGFVLIAHDGAQQRIQQLRWVSLGAGIAVIAALAIAAGQGADPAFGTGQYALIFSLLAVCSWCWILAILGFGMKHLTRSTPFLQHANEAVLPFYVMHQTVILVVGYFVVQSGLPDLLKWVVIAASSFAIIVSLYEFVIRRVNVLRVLFGMKPAKPAPAPVTTGMAPAR